MNQQSLPTEILQWLFRVLQPEYVDPRLAYHDIAVTLQSYPTLKPRTRVYTSENGEPLLLMNLYGSLPANIQGRIYKIPVELWIPHEYPFAAPIAYVVPTEKMVLQPGNHVDTNGRCYLPYLASWGNTEQQQSNVVSLCGELSTVFSRESPVFSKPSTPSQRTANMISTPMSNLQPHPTGTSNALNTPQPPPLPSKSNQESSSNSTNLYSPAPEHLPKQALTPPIIGTGTTPPPLPPLPEELRSRMIQSPTLNKMNEQSHTELRPVFEQPNIMDRLKDTIDGDNTIHTDRERESGLERVRSMLQNIYESDISMSLSKFKEDINQIKYAIGKFDKIFEYETDGLNKINSQITENEMALNQALSSAHEIIIQAENFKKINTDEIICAETVVFNQLYDLVADDQAIGDTIYALTKAHDHGLIPLTSFIKHTRNLARDQFMKKALIVKITGQLGLQQ